MSQGHELDGLTLLQDAAGGTKLIQMVVYHCSRDSTDLIIREALDRIHQNIFIHKEGISGHLLKLLVRKVGLAVWNEFLNIVLPSHCEQDVVQQVLAAVTNSAGFEALTMTGNTPLPSSSVTHSTTCSPRVIARPIPVATAMAAHATLHAFTEA